jgi:hypothetical protein
LGCEIVRELGYPTDAWSPEGPRAFGEHQTASDEKAKDEQSIYQPSLAAFLYGGFTGIFVLQ